MLLLSGLALTAGMLAAVGSFLVWTGVTYSSTIDRRISLGAGALGIVLTRLARAGRSRLLALSIVAAVVALNMGMVNFLDISQHAYEYRAYPHARVGPGIYLVIAGGGFMLVAGIGALLPASPKRPATGAGPPSSG